MYESVKIELQGKVLVDATARVDWRKPRPPEGKAAARMAQELLGPQVRVVAAFQNIPASALARPEQRLESDVLVCGDDPQARATTNICCCCRRTPTAPASSCARRFGRRPAVTWE